MSTPRAVAQSSILLSILTVSLSFLLSHSSSPPAGATVCIIGSGIGGSSVAHFLRKYSNPLTSTSPPAIGTVHIFERNGVVGGRMATVTVAGETFEAGASILHPKNYHAANYTRMFGLKQKTEFGDDSSLGIWDGKGFVYKTLKTDVWKYPFMKQIVQQINSLKLLWRYGFSLFTMQSFIENTVGKFLKYYDSHDSRPVFETVEEMLQWSGLYNLTSRTLEEELVEAGLSPLLIQELVTVITRINYGQSVSISGMAGAVSMAGSVDGLWAVEGGNWQMAKGLIEGSDVKLHLSEEITSVSRTGKSYELSSVHGNSYDCEVVVVATPLDEVKIELKPLVFVPQRKLHHTFTTFVRGQLNPAYFGLRSMSEVPKLIGTLEDPNIPFSSISILKKHGEKDATYKIFSRKPLDDALLDQFYSIREETIRIDWAAYPHYEAPEQFAPFILDDTHLYYVNAFESGASTMETSAVAAENIARLILSRLSSDLQGSCDECPMETSEKGGNQDMVAEL